LPGFLESLPASWRAQKRVFVFRLEGLGALLARPLGKHGPTALYRALVTAIFGAGLSWVKGRAAVRVGAPAIVEHATGNAFAHDRTEALIGRARMEHHAALIAGAIGEDIAAPVALTLRRAANRCKALRLERLAAFDAVRSGILLMRMK
jgi:hypothetical protein